MNIYVSNIAYTTTDEALQEVFAAFGAVESARIIKDRMTGRSRGFGFVEMPNDDEGRKAIEGVNGVDLGGRRLNAREARPREEGGARNGGENAARPPRQEQPQIQVINRGVY